MVPGLLMLLLLLLAAPPGSFSATPLPLPISFDTQAPLRSNIPLDFLGVNIDTASVAQVILYIEHGLI